MVRSAYWFNFSISRFAQFRPPLGAARPRGSNDDRDKVGGAEGVPRRGAEELVRLLGASERGHLRRRRAQRAKVGETRRGSGEELLLNL